MSIETMIVLAVSALTMIYLLYALLRPVWRLSPNH